MGLVVFRADGGPSIGAGHVMRCLSLAGHFQDNGWRVGFAASRESFDSVAALANSPVEAFRLPDEGDVPLLLRKNWPGGACILLVDHYGLDAEFERACRPWAARIVVLDDLADRSHDADVLADAAGSAAAYRRWVRGDCAILTGQSFAVLNAAFLRARREVLDRHTRQGIERVAIGFGQIDAPNATLRAIRALREAGYTERVDVFLGSAAPNLAAVRAAAAGNIHLHVDSTDLPSLLAQADLAIGAGGMSAWERCCLGVPSILVELAENQQATIWHIAKAGAGVDVGAVDDSLVPRLAESFSSLMSDRERLLSMSRAAAKLVDGRGGERVMLAAIEPAPTSNGTPINVRLAESDDEDWLLALQSKPETRRFANDPAVPTPDGHARWFANALDDPDRSLMIVEYCGRRAGMLRLDRISDARRVSIAVDPEFHRRGIGAATLEFASRLVPGKALEAEVLSGNDASLALFLRAGYRQAGPNLFKRLPS